MHDEHIREYALLLILVCIMIFAIYLVAKVTDVQEQLSMAQAELQAMKASSQAKNAELAGKEQIIEELKMQSGSIIEELKVTLIADKFQIIPADELYFAECSWCYRCKRIQY